MLTLASVVLGSDYYNNPSTPEVDVETVGFVHLQLNFPFPIGAYDYRYSDYNIPVCEYDASSPPIFESTPVTVEV
jgi:hypothetical protein